MKSVFVPVFVIAAVVILTSARPEEKSAGQVDNVNVDEILKSDRLLRNYINCFLDKGKCTPDAADLKKNLPDLLEHGCPKCTEDQKSQGIKVARFLIDNKRDWWNELAAKYDPNGEYIKKYQAEAKKENINL